MADKKTFLDYEGLVKYHNRLNQFIDNKIDDKLDWDNLKNKPFGEIPEYNINIFNLGTTEGDTDNWAYFESGDLFNGENNWYYTYNNGETINGHNVIEIYNYDWSTGADLSLDLENKELTIDMDGTSYTGRMYYYHAATQDNPSEDIEQKSYLFGALPSGWEFDEDAEYEEWSASGQSEFPFSIVITKNRNTRYCYGYIFDSIMIPVDDSDHNIVFTFYDESGSITETKVIDNRYLDLSLEDLNGAIDEDTGLIESEYLPSFVKDWNENDSSNISYIENRTHYDSREGLCSVWQDIRFYRSCYNSSTKTYEPWPWPDTLVEGNEYTINLELLEDNNTVCEKTFTSVFENNGFKYEGIIVTITSRDGGIGTINVYMPTENNIPLESINNVQNLSLNFKIDDDLVVISDLAYSSADYGAIAYPSISNGRYSRPIDNITRNIVYFEIGSYNYSVVENLPVIQNGLYSLTVNGDLYKLICSQHNYNFSTISYLGNFGYYQIYRASSSSSVNITSREGEEDYDFCIVLNDGKVIVICDVNSELYQKIKYPNLKEFVLQYGYVQQLDSKYIPTAKDISQNGEGFVTSNQVYDYVSNSIDDITSIEASDINSLFES